MCRERLLRRCRPLRYQVRDAAVVMALMLGLRVGPSFFLPKLASHRSTLYQSTSPTPASEAAIIMFDNRELEADFWRAPYSTLAAVINSEYARSHGLQFRYYLPRFSPSEVPAARIVADESCLRAAAGDAVTKMRVPPDASDIWCHGGENNSILRQVAYHFGLETTRASTWGKLVAAWDAAGAFARIMFIDSDAIIVNRSGSVFDVLSGGGLERVAGVPVHEATVVFFSNHPWGRETPCAGIFFLAHVPSGHCSSARPTVRVANDGNLPTCPPSGQTFARWWWDQPGWADEYLFEQSALHFMLRTAAGDTASARQRWMASAVSVLYEPQFDILPRVGARGPARIVEHITGSLQRHAARASRMRSYLIEELGLSAAGFRAAVEALQATAVVRIDMLQEAARMHASSCDEAAHVPGHFMYEQQRLPQSAKEATAQRDVVCAMRQEKKATRPQSAKSKKIKKKRL